MLIDRTVVQTLVRLRMDRTETSVFVTVCMDSWRQQQTSFVILRKDSWRRQQTSCSSRLRKEKCVSVHRFKNQSIARDIYAVPVLSTTITEEAGRDSNKLSVSGLASLNPQGTLSRASSAAVSYTHLTLPTRMVV